MPGTVRLMTISRGQIRAVTEHRVVMAGRVASGGSNAGACRVCSGTKDALVGIRHLESAYRLQLQRTSGYPRCQG